MRSTASAPQRRARRRRRAPRTAPERRYALTDFTRRVIVFHLTQQQSRFHSALDDVASNVKQALGGGGGERVSGRDGRGAARVRCLT